MFSLSLSFISPRTQQTATTMFEAMRTVTSPGLAFPNLSPTHGQFTHHPSCPLPAHYTASRPTSKPASTTSRTATPPPRAHAAPMSNSHSNKRNPSRPPPPSTPRSPCMRALATFPPPTAAPSPATSSRPPTKR